MSVVSKVVGGLLLVSALSSCSSNTRWESTNVIDKQVKKVMADKPFTDYEKATASWRAGAAGVADAQSTLDSAAYRKVFESTQGVKDSALVKEFNQIASQYRVPKTAQYADEVQAAFVDVVKDKFSVAEVESVKNISSMFSPYIIAGRQHAVDSIAYNKFFRENNLLNSDTTQMVKQQVEKMIKPVQKTVGRQNSIKFM